MRYTGNPVSKGIALGRVYCYQPFSPQLQNHSLNGLSPQEGIDAYELLRQNAKTELETIVHQFQTTGALDKAKIFTAHLDILFDEAVHEEVCAHIEEDGESPDWAISQVYDQFIKLLGKSKDPLIRERVADLKDVKNRLLRISAGVVEQDLSALKEPVVVVAYDLLPSETAMLNRENVLAIVTEIGGSTSHSAILARSYEIPAVLGVNGAMNTFKDVNEIIIDAITGEIFTDPTPEQKAEYEQKRQAFLDHQKIEKTYLSAPCRMADNTKIHIELNIGTAQEQELQGEAYTDGVGLFRTEFLYMGRNQLPTEEEQFVVYQRVLERFGNRPVIIRTLDIGGDKELPYMELPKEENPFLGNRALRLCFQHPDIFKTQLRALLRSSVYGNLWVMFPMVGSLDDIQKAKAALEEARTELQQEGIRYGNIKVGIMVEIPSIALLSDLAATEVDFASIGTNDLIQYTTASDRMNPAVSSYYQSFHPGVFRLIRQVAQAFQAQQKPLSVCGELAGAPLTSAVLVGFGIDRLSMGLSSIGSVKKMLTGLDMHLAQSLANSVCKMGTSDEVESFLKQKLAPLL